MPRDIKNFSKSRRKTDNTKAKEKDDDKTNQLTTL